MITLRQAFHFLACKEAERIAWYKTSIIIEGPKSSDWTSYSRSKQMASLYLTAISLIKYFGLDQQGFKKLTKSDIYAALNENPRSFCAHCPRRKAPKMLRRALKQIKRADLASMEKDVAPWVKERDAERELRLAEASK